MVKKEVVRGYDILGNLVIVKFSRGVKLSEKKKWAVSFLSERKQVKTVLEKVDKFKGRLRTLSTRWIFGDKTKEAIYRENDCMFRFNTDTCYFSPRLASERLEIARMVGKKEEVLVLFGGVAPFAIVIGKISGCKRVVSVELGRECSKYALENVKRNKLNNVEIVQGDVRRVLPKMTAGKEKFDRIVMARPNLKDSFLDVSFPLVRKNGMIHYYGFYDAVNLDELRGLIEIEAEKAGRKIKILDIKKAGDIGVRKFRYRVDVKILN